MDLYLARLVRKEPLSDDPKRLREQADELVRQNRIHEAIKAYEKLWALPGTDQNGRYSIMCDLFAAHFSGNARWSKSGSVTSMGGFMLDCSTNWIDTSNSGTYAGPC